MTRPTIVAVLAVAAGVGLTATASEAGRRGGTGRCIAAARLARNQCFQTCTATFQTDFLGCFGKGKSCAQTCLTAKLLCESGPLKTQEECASDPKNPQSCRAQLQSALQACKTNPDPSACADVAQLAALKCRQACVDAAEPQLSDCGDAFRLCLRSCPTGSPSGAFLDPR
jgi:hypothetical protein